MITIIVLLILAGINISMLAGDNGILQRAAYAKTKSYESQIEEEIKLAVGEAIIEGYGSLNANNLQKALSNYEIKSSALIGNGPWDEYVENKVFGISEHGDVELEISDLKAGLYKNNILVKTWDELVENNILIVDDGILSTPEDTEIGVISSNGNKISASRENLEGMLVINNNVTNIKDGAFMYCRKITNIILPSSINSIGIDAFRDCSSLNSINISSNINSIGKNAFSGSNLSYIEIPENCFVDESAFLVCNNLSNVKIGKNVTLGENSFTSSKVQEITIEENSIITQKAFLNCDALISVTLESGVNIGEASFANCSSLKNVTIKDGVTSIGKGAFLACTGLDRLDIPSSVTTIGENAFAGVKHVYYTGTATGQPWGADNIN